MSWSMALLLILNLLAPLGTVSAAGGADKTTVLTNVGVTVKQNGTEITGSTLENADNLSIEVSFGVPVAGDYPDGTPDPGTIVQQGDTADISLGKGFSLSAVSGSLPIALVTESGITVGHITAFNTSDTGAVTAHVEFDVQHGAGGDNLIDFENDSGVKAGFNANLQVNSDGGQDGSGNTIFTILNKTYTIVPPAVPTTYTVTKSGTVDLKNKCVNWTVNITAAKGSTPIDLAGYTFSDDLTNVGDYISDSFKVGPSSETPTQTGLVLSYAFPEGSTSPQTVTFSTSLTDTECYSTTGWTKNNTAQLKKGDDVVAEKEGTVPFTPKWIEKAGVANNETVSGTGAFDPHNQTITWTITANQMGASLNGVVITDALKDGLIWKSAKVQTWDADSNTWVDSSTTWDTEPTDGKYALASINTMVLLTIVTKVPEAEYTTGKTTYHNSANISWTGLAGDGIGTRNIGVAVGYNAITKSGTLDSSYQTNQKIHWSVTVDPKGQAIPSMKVYDLLVYGNSIDLSKVTGIPDGMDSKNLKPQYNQKYQTGTFSGAGSLTNVYTLTDSGHAVADLLEISLTGTAASTFTFDSQVVNPDIYAGNMTSIVYNTATLFSANAKLNEATANVPYPSNMLAKETLKRDSDPATAAGANNKTTNASECFDYVDKSVIFRLSVNADGMDLTNMPIGAQGTKLGSVTVTDTLPEGWVFDKIDGKDFLIFAGSTGSNKSVTATGAALANPSFVTPILNGTTSDGKNKTATFTFSTLNAPYVILVKARPTDDTAAGYFDKNQSTTVTNSLNLKTENWTPGISTSQNVKIDSTILSKNLDSSKANSEAYLTWTVEYKPYELNGKGTQIVDTLPEGIDLRTDASGNLALTDRDGHANISINELTLQADGSYTVGDPVAPASGTNVSYDSVGRALTFKIPDPAKAYRFTYVTDITGNSGSITNQVKLYGGNSNNVETNKSYNIVEQSGWATLQRGGSLTVTKTDETGTALTGAVFTLYASDGTTVIRKGTVAADGTLKMRAIPEGKYILRETAIPGGYLSENVSATPADHTVTVTVSGSTVTTSIDGKTGIGSNELTVKNYREGVAGNLTIGKTVAGNAGDQKKAFKFTLSLTGAPDTYQYIGSGVPDGSIKNGDTVSLTHGQSISVIGLPKNAVYTVTEENDSADGYTTASTVTAANTLGTNSSASGKTVTGTIVADDTQTASFTNTKNVYVPSTGNLTISKTVAGPGADTAKQFNFTVTFTGAPGSYPYTGNGVSAGTIHSGDTFALANGQSITITGLPAGASYQVSENADSAQGYKTESAGSSGTISVGDQTAAFTNTKITNPGSLTIHKVVEGKGASQTRKFRFTVTFTGAPDAYPYAGSASGTLHSGDAVMLSSGQSITIAGLPAGAGYTVTEADYSGVGYTTSSTGASGVISSGTTQTASFTNSWSPLPNEPGKPKNPTVDIGDEDIPTGNTDGENHDVPDGGNDVNTPDGEKSGLPRTGDDQKRGLAEFGLFFSSAALAVFAAADYVLRRKNHGKKNK